MDKSTTDNRDGRLRYRNTGDLKWCPRCHQQKSLDDFGVARKRPDGRMAFCRPCWSDYRKEYMARNPDQAQKKRDYMRGYLYGMDPNTYTRLFEAQGGVCAICGKPEPEFRRLRIDHDHTTGKVRGLLCSGCNTGLTRFGDSPEGLQRVLDYVMRGRETTNHP